MATRKKTLSASVDTRIYDALREAAAETGRSRSAIVSSALELYASLPRICRRAFEDALRATGQEGLEGRERFLRDLQRFLLRSRWDELSERIDREVGDVLPPEASEEDLLRVAEEAVRETRDSRRSA